MRNDSDHQADLGTSVLKTVLVLGGGLTPLKVSVVSPFSLKFQ